MQDNSYIAMTNSSSLEQNISIQLSKLLFLARSCNKNLLENYNVRKWEPITTSKQDYTVRNILLSRRTRKEDILKIKSNIFQKVELLTKNESKTFTPLDLREVADKSILSETKSLLILKYFNQQFGKKVIPKRGKVIELKYAEHKLKSMQPNNQEHSHVAEEEARVILKHTNIPELGKGSQNTMVWHHEKKYLNIRVLVNLQFLKSKCQTLDLQYPYSTKNNELRSCPTEFKKDRRTRNSSHKNLENRLYKEKSVCLTQYTTTSRNNLEHLSQFQITSSVKEIIAINSVIKKKNEISWLDNFICGHNISNNKDLATNLKSKSIILLLKQQLVPDVIIPRSNSLKHKKKESEFQKLQEEMLHMQWLLQNKRFLESKSSLLVKSYSTIISRKLTAINNKYSSDICINNKKLNEAKFKSSQGMLQKRSKQKQIKMEDKESLLFAIDLNYCEDSINLKITENDTETLIRIINLNTNYELSESFNEINNTRYIYNVSLEPLTITDSEIFIANIDLDESYYCNKSFPEINNLRNIHSIITQDDDEKFILDIDLEEKYSNTVFLQSQNGKFTEHNPLEETSIRPRISKSESLLPQTVKIRADISENVVQNTIYRLFQSRLRPSSSTSSVLKVLDKSCATYSHPSYEVTHSSNDPPPALMEIKFVDNTQDKIKAKEEMQLQSNQGFPNRNNGQGTMKRSKFTPGENLIEKKKIEYRRKLQLFKDKENIIYEINPYGNDDESVSYLNLEDNEDTKLDQIHAKESIGIKHQPITPNDELNISHENNTIPRQKCKEEQKNFLEEEVVTDKQEKNLEENIEIASPINTLQRNTDNTNPIIIPENISYESDRFKTKDSKENECVIPQTKAMEPIKMSCHKSTQYDFNDRNLSAYKDDSDKSLVAEVKCHSPKRVLSENNTKVENKISVASELNNDQEYNSVETKTTKENQKESVCTHTISQDNTTKIKEKPSPKASKFKFKIRLDTIINTVSSSLSSTKTKTNSDMQFLKGKYTKYKDADGNKEQTNKESVETEYESAEILEEEGKPLHPEDKRGECKCNSNLKQKPFRQLLTRIHQQFKKIFHNPVPDVNSDINVSLSSKSAFSGNEVKTIDKRRCIVRVTEDGLECFTKPSTVAQLKKTVFPNIKDTAHEKLNTKSRRTRGNVAAYQFVVQMSVKNSLFSFVKPKFPNTELLEHICYCKYNVRQLILKSLQLQLKPKIITSISSSSRNKNLYSYLK